MACKSPTIVVGGVTISTSDFENAIEILSTVSGDNGDPTLDEFEENIANGNNDKNATGVQFPPPTQTTPPAPISEPPVESTNTPPPTQGGVIPGCDPWTGDYNMQLSPNFTVKSFTVGAVFPHKVIDYPGFTANVRVCNLKAVAINIAEPMRAKFGNALRINSGLRNTTSSSSVSQHIKGQAIDVQFVGWTYKMYWDNAVWVKDNIPFDQFIFEHSSSTGLAWYHLSFNRAGNRPASNPTKVMTMYKNKYLSGLHRFG